jgi:hypothetical protein
MIPPKSKPQVPVVHQCPVCHHPQTKIQRRLNGTAHGSIIYVCARPTSAAGDQPEQGGHVGGGVTAESVIG